MERWLGSDDPDVRSIMKANLDKARMVALGGEWLSAMRQAFDS